jgi:hypothetical protein
MFVIVISRFFAKFCLIFFSDSILKILECQAVWYLISQIPECKKLTMLELIQYHARPTQSDIFGPYWTEIIDVGMPKPLLVLNANADLCYNHKVVVVWTTG